MRGVSAWDRVPTPRVAFRNDRDEENGNPYTFLAYGPSKYLNPAALPRGSSQIP